MNQSSCNLSVIIPAFNEMHTIKPLLEKVKSISYVNEIIVVDDFSNDNTRELLIELRKKYNFKLILNEKNLGKGASIKEAIKYLTGNYVIIQDADLEYNPEEYIKLINEINDNVSVVFGSRFIVKQTTNIPLSYFLANKILTKITNVLYGSRLTDMETCYKLMPCSVLKEFKLSASRFDFEPEITAKILNAGLKIKEVPVSYDRRSIIQGKKISWYDGIAAIRVLFKYRFFNR